MTYDLPLPISTNALFFNLPRGGRAKTDKYKKWIADARWSLLSQRARPVTGQVNLQILVSEKSKIDIDNALKSAIDVLVAHGVLENDSPKFVRGILLEWSSEVEGVRVIITPARGKENGDVEHDSVDLGGRNQGRIAEKALG